MTNIPYSLLDTRMMSKEPPLNKTTCKQGDSHIHKHTHAELGSPWIIKLLTTLTTDMKEHSRGKCAQTSEHSSDCLWT